LLTFFFTSFFSTFTSPVGVVVVAWELESVVMVSAPKTIPEKETATRAATMLEITVIHLIILLMGLFASNLIKAFNMPSFVIV
jgi:hypothetical protein